MSKVTVPMAHKLIGGTLATVIGGWAFWKAGRDFEFIKFEPRSPEEIEKLKEQGFHLLMKQGDSRNLDYTPEAKERLRQSMKEIHEKQQQSKESK